MRLKRMTLSIFEGAGESTVNWTAEAWASSQGGIECLKAAGSDTEAILNCRRNLHHSLAAGASVATFNLLLGVGLAFAILARVW